MACGHNYIEYKEGDKKIFEVIEVENIPILRADSRTRNMGGKAARSALAEVSDERFRLEESGFKFDRFYFSLCLNATGLDGPDIERSDRFKDALDNITDNVYKGMIKKFHNIYKRMIEEFQSKQTVYLKRNEPHRPRYIPLLPRNFELHNIYILLNSRKLQAETEREMVCDGNSYLYRYIRFPVRLVSSLDYAGERSSSK